MDKSKVKLTTLNEQDPVEQFIHSIFDNKLSHAVPLLRGVVYATNISHPSVFDGDFLRFVYIGEPVIDTIMYRSMFGLWLSPDGKVLPQLGTAYVRPSMIIDPADVNEYLNGFSSKSVEPYPYPGGSDRALQQTSSIILEGGDCDNSLSLSTEQVKALKDEIVNVFFDSSLDDVDPPIPLMV